MARPRNSSGRPGHVKGTFSFELVGIDELQRALKMLPKSMRRTPLLNALKAAGQPTMELAKANAPHGPTGNLADSIHVATQLNRNQRKRHQRMVDGVEVFIGSNAPHAHLVEFGTAERMREGGVEPRVVGQAAGTMGFDEGGAASFEAGDFIFRTTGPGTGRMKPNPFLTRAWDATKHGALEILKRHLWAEIQAAARRVSKRAQKGTLSVKVQREILEL